MEFDKVEFEGEDITSEVVGEATDKLDPTAELDVVSPDNFQEAEVIAMPIHTDIHANDVEEDVDAEMSDEEWANKAFPLPEDFPSRDEIDAWRQRYGRVRIRRMGPKEAYITRPLQRGEIYTYEKLQHQAADAEGYDQTKLNLEIEEAIVSLCMLYPLCSQEQLHGSDPDFHNPVLVAGTIGFLALDILVSSNIIGESPTVVEDL